MAAPAMKEVTATNPRRAKTRNPVSSKRAAIGPLSRLTFSSTLVVSVVFRPFLDAVVSLSAVLTVSLIPTARVSLSQIGQRR